MVKMGKYTDNELKESLYMAYEVLKSRNILLTTTTYVSLRTEKEYSYLPSYQIYLKKYGSWKTTLIATGLDKIVKDAKVKSKLAKKLYDINVNGVIRKGKKCRVCLDIKLLEEMTSSKLDATGKASICKECKATQVRKYYAENTEKALASGKKWVENNKEKYRAQKARWYANNKEKFLEYRHNYYEENKEKEFERMKYYSKKWRTNQYNLPFNLSIKEENEIKEMYQHSCCLTGETKTAHFEHFIPLSWGHGGTYKGNLYLLSKPLNISKKDRNPFKWIEKTSFQNEIDMSKWDELVKRLACENNMTIKEFRDYVYWCEANKRTPNESKSDNRLSSEIWRESLVLRGGHL